MTLCTVAYAGMEDYLGVLIDSVLSRLTLISEIVIARTDVTQTGLLYSHEKPLPIHIVGAPTEAIGYSNVVCGHAFGLHAAIDHASNPYLFFCDPDVFFLSPVDRLYLDLEQKHDLGFVGVSHFNLQEAAIGAFPVAINMLTRKDRLPTPDWLDGRLFLPVSFRGYQPSNRLLPGSRYLMLGSPFEWWREFPKPDGIFDVGSNLWLWAKRTDQRWLGFYLERQLDCFTENRGQEDDIVYPLNYSLNRYESNFGLSEDLGDTDLCYHRTGGSRHSSATYLDLYHRLFPERRVKAFLL